MWLPNEKQKMYSKSEKFEISESGKLYDSSICIPSGLDINAKKITYIYSVINNAYKKFLLEKDKKNY